MNVNIPFIWVPILAVACYLFLMIALLSAKKNNIILYSAFSLLSPLDRRFHADETAGLPGI